MFVPYDLHIHLYIHWYPIHVFISPKIGAFGMFLYICAYTDTAVSKPSFHKHEQRSHFMNDLYLPYFPVFM